MPKSSVDLHKKWAFRVSITPIPKRYTRNIPGLPQRPICKSRDWIIHTSTTTKPYNGLTTKGGKSEQHVCLPTTTSIHHREKQLFTVRIQISIANSRTPIFLSS